MVALLVLHDVVSKRTSISVLNDKTGWACLISNQTHHVPRKVSISVALLLLLLLLLLLIIMIILLFPYGSVGVDYICGGLGVIFLSGNSVDAWLEGVMLWVDGSVRNPRISYWLTSITGF